MSLLFLINRYFLKYFKLKLIQPHKKDYPIDFVAETSFITIYELCKPHTMTSIERMHAAAEAISYVEKNKIEGDIVECGVWRGGSSMIMALRLKEMNSTHRNLFLYDTYEGMTDPTEKDVDFTGQHSEVRLKKEDKKKGANVWCYSPIEEVQANLQSTGYPLDKINFVKGKVEETIPSQIPQKIAVLRLDTDWYESTKHELEHLFPLLSKNGILIIDDYGHWRGSRQAVDEYFEKLGIVPFLHRIDYSGRLYMKQ